MPNFTAQDVKELREITNIGMMDCKKALQDADGDRDKALKILKEKGLAVAAKRADRITKEGVIAIALSDDSKQGHMIKLGCETDFVARSEDFNALARSLLSQYQAEGEGFIGSDKQNSQITDVSGKTGEKIELAESCQLTAGEGFIDSYLHSNSKVGVLVEIECPADLCSNEAVRSFSKDITMQIASMSPVAVTQADIDEDTIAEQKEIIAKQMEGTDKAPEVLEKIAQGKLSKALSDLSLMDMLFVKDTKIKISELCKKVSTQAGGAISIKRFSRMQIG